jgi:hypothetical protein
MTGETGKYGSPVFPDFCRDHQLQEKLDTIKGINKLGIARFYPCQPHQLQFFVLRVCGLHIK